MNNLVIELAREDWVGPISNFIALLLGAGLTYFTTLYFEKRKAKLDVLKGSWSLFFAVQSMVDDLIKLNQNREASLNLANSDGRMSAQFWQKWQDEIGYGDPLTSLSSADLAILADTRDGEFVTQVREIESAHRIYLLAAQKISDLRLKLAEHSVPSGKEGTVIGFDVGPKGLPIIAQLEGLGSSFENGLPEAVVSAKLTASALGPHLKAHYRFKHFAELIYDSTGVSEVVKD